MALEVTKVTKDILRFLIFDVPIVTAAALSNYDPTMAAVWAGATTFLSRTTQHERQIFFEELFKQEIEENLLSSLEFFRATSVTFEAVSKTASAEKIRVLARLLRSSTTQGLIEDFDEFKEFVRLVDEISPKEFLVLKIMDTYKDWATPTHGIRKSSPLVPSNGDREAWARYEDDLYDYEASIVTVHPLGGMRRQIPVLLYRWEVAEEVIKQQLNIERSRVVSLMNRLVRTGCVEERAFPHLGSVSLAYKLTPLYFALKRYIEDAAEN